jgi:hypothetical protein
MDFLVDGGRRRLPLENQMKTVDTYGDYVKTAVGVWGGSFIHFHQAIINMAGKDLRNAHIMLKTGIGAFSSH